MITPIVERELAVALRKKNQRRSRFIYALIGVGLAVLALLLGPGGGPISHQFLFLAGLFAVIPDTLNLASSLFVEERQNGSLGFLFLAGLNVFEMFAGKILGSFMVASVNLLALMPCMAMPFLVGGVSFQLFAWTICCLPVLLLFILSLVCFASAFCGEESSARVLAVVIGGVLCIAPLGFYEVMHWGAHPVSGLIRSLSPAWGAWTVYHRAAGNGTAFWLNMAITVFYSCVFFLLAGFNLRKAWNREVEGALPGDGKQSLWSRISAWVSPRPQRASFIADNPYIGISLRDRRPVRLAWLVMGMIVACSLFCAWAAPHSWLRSWMVFAVALALNGSMEWICAYAAARPLGDARRGGVLETVLSTPLGSRDIVDGQLIALEKQFRPVFYTVLALHCGLLTLGAVTRTWTTGALWDYLLVWLLFFVWTGRRLVNDGFRSLITAVWVGYNSGAPGFAANRACGFHTGWYWNLYSFSNVFMMATRFPSGSQLEMTLVTIFVVIVLAVALHNYYSKEYLNITRIEDMMLADFRLIAAEPMPDPSDPQLKNWKINQRLYRNPIGS